MSLSQLSDYTTTSTKNSTSLVPTIIDDVLNDTSPTTSQIHSARQLLQGNNNLLLSQLLQFIDIVNKTPNYRSQNKDIGSFQIGWTCTYKTNTKSFLTKEDLQFIYDNFIVKRQTNLSRAITLALEVHNNNSRELLSWREGFNYQYIAYINDLARVTDV